MKWLFIIAVSLLIVLLGKALHASFFPNPPCPQGMSILVLKDGDTICLVHESPMQRRNWKPYDPKIQPGKQT